MPKLCGFSGQLSLYQQSGTAASLQQYVCILGNGSSALVNLFFLPNMNLLFSLGGLLCTSNRTGGLAVLYSPCCINLCVALFQEDLLMEPVLLCRHFPYSCNKASLL